MTFLTLDLIWTGTLALNAISFVSFLVLLTIVAFANTARYSNDKRQAELEKILMVHLTFPLKNLKDTFVGNKRDIEILANLSEKLLYILDEKHRDELRTFIWDTGLEGEIISYALKGRTKKKLLALRLMSLFPTNERYLTILRETFATAKDPQVVYMAAYALSRHRVIADLTMMLERLDKMSEISTPLLFDIFLGYGNGIIEPLKEIAKSNTLTKKTKLAVIQCMGSLNHVEVPRLLLKLANSTDDDTAAMAFHSLARQSFPIETEILDKGALRKDWRIRKNVAICAGFSAKLPIVTLTKLLGDENWLVSMHAAKSFLNAGNSGRRILKMLAGQQNRIGARALSFLSEEEERAA